MSTAPPQGSSAEAELLPILDVPPEVPAAATVASHPQPEHLDFAPASCGFDNRVDRPHVGQPVPTDSDAVDSSVLEDTVSFSLDDTHVIPVAQLAAAQSVRANTGGVASSLAIDAPSATGPLDGLFYESIKRWLDIVISATALVLLSPVLLISALIVKFTDGGAIFYPHPRVGEGGNEFTCYKFRSMVVNADKMKAELTFFNSHDDQRTFKIPNDPRVTPFGRWMRRMSVDELPQLWNVLKGDMSVVGPRPPVVSEVEQYTWDDMQRLAVKPGLTCIWQVSGRSRLPFPEQLKMDLEYIENRSLALDLKLMLLTIPAVVSADGAY